MWTPAENVILIYQLSPAELKAWSSLKRENILETQRDTGGQVKSVMERLTKILIFSRTEFPTKRSTQQQTNMFIFIEIFSILASRFISFNFSSSKDLLFRESFSYPSYWKHRVSTVKRTLELRQPTYTYLLPHF